MRRQARPFSREARAEAGSSKHKKRAKGHYEKKPVKSGTSDTRLHPKNIYHLGKVRHHLDQLTILWWSSVHRQKHKPCRETGAPGTPRPGKAPQWSTCTDSDSHRGKSNLRPRHRERERDRERETEREREREREREVTGFTTVMKINQWKIAKKKKRQKK